MCVLWSMYICFRVRVGVHCPISNSVRVSTNWMSVAIGSSSRRSGSSNLCTAFAIHVMQLRRNAKFVANRFVDLISRSQRVCGYFMGMRGESTLMVNNVLVGCGKGLRSGQRSIMWKLLGEGWSMWDVVVFKRRHLGYRWRMHFFVFQRQNMIHVKGSRFQASLRHSLTNRRFRPFFSVRRCFYIEQSQWLLEIGNRSTIGGGYDLSMSDGTNGRWFGICMSGWKVLVGNERTERWRRIGWDGKLGILVFNLICVGWDRWSGLVHVDVASSAGQLVVSWFRCVDGKFVENLSECIGGTVDCLWFCV